MTELWISVVTGLLTLAGVCVTAYAGAKKTRDEVAQRLSMAQAVTDYKLEQLTREVRLHNDFARRVPVLEEKVRALSARPEPWARGKEQEWKNWN